MTMSVPISGPGPGFRVSNVDHTMTCTPGCSKGDIMVLSKTAVLPVAGANPVFTTVIVPTGAADDIESLDTGIACVALQDVAAAGTGSFRFSGVVEARGGDTSGVGLALMFDTNKELVAATAAGKMVAFALEAVAVDTLGLVLFDGVNGFSGVPTT